MTVAEFHSTGWCRLCLISPMTRPNLLFVFADQFRAQAMGYSGQDPVITPNFDRFAEESLVLTDAISNVPVCSPYRGMLISGQFPFKNGLTGNCGPQHGMEMDTDAVCFGDALKCGGYQTGYIGKLHLEKAKTVPRPGLKRDVWTPPGPRRCGFDFWYAFNSGSDHFHPHYWFDSEEPIWIDKWSVEHEANVAIDFIRRRDRSRPFALFVSWYPPHPPLVAPEEDKLLYKGKDLPLRENAVEAKGRREYFAAVSSCDRHFQRLLDALEKEGLSDDTIVVFTADHGEMMGSHGRLQKGIWYEESINVPFLLRWPNEVGPGRDDLLLGTTDIMPTLVGLMGVDIPDSADGTDYSQTIRGDAGSRPKSTFIAAYPYPGRFHTREFEGGGIAKHAFDIEVGLSGIDWKTWGYREVRTHRYTYVIDRSSLYRINTVEPYIGEDWTPEEFAERLRNGKQERRLLYDNISDPYQLSPYEGEAAGRHLAVEELEGQLRGWLERMEDPFKV